MRLRALLGLGSRIRDDAWLFFSMSVLVSKSSFICFDSNCYEVFNGAFVNAIKSSVNTIPSRPPMGVSGENLIASSLFIEKSLVKFIVSPMDDTIAGYSGTGLWHVPSALNMCDRSLAKWLR